MITTYHLTIDLAHAAGLSDDGLCQVLQAETGHWLTPWQARRRLRQAQGQGYTVLPLCDKMNAAGYCQGHQREERRCAGS